jgi:phage tail sheath gpL-like
MVAFQTIPSTLRTPFVYVETDHTQASASGSGAQPTLIVGQRRSTGSVAAGVMTRITSAGQGATYFGRASMLDHMIRAYFRNDPFGEVWAIALDDEGAGVAATATLTVTGPSTAAGTIYLYIGGRLVTTAVASGDAQNTIASAINTAIGADADLPVSSSVSTNVVTLTARHKGAQGNKIDVRLNYRGLAGGESLPAGVSIAIVAMANGATDPSVATAITAMGDQRYDFIVQPYPVAANLNRWRDELTHAASSGRWGGTRMLYGHAFTCETDTVSNLGTLGATRNDAHHTIWGINKSPTPPWEIAAAAAGAAAASLRIHPARPVQTLPALGVLPPAEADRFTLTERNTLLNAGISTFTIGRDGTVRLETTISTYQTNAHGDEDESYLYVETPYTLTRINRDWRAHVQSKFPRSILVDNGTRFGTGLPMVTPNMLRGEAIAKYAEWELAGYVENADLFAEHLVVERDPDNAQRVNMVLPPDLANQFRILAVLNQFRIQYPAAAAA